MPRTISLGAQGFVDIRENGYFYIDKSDFVTRWWESADVVTLICRPRRFGKTLNLRTVECFLSPDFADAGELLFGDLKVWQSERMRRLQGTVPVVFISFADCKGGDFAEVRAKMFREVAALFDRNRHLLESDLTPNERAQFEAVLSDMGNADFTGSLKLLCTLLEAYHGAKPVVLLDEYDTPMQEAWLGGWWDEMVDLVRPFMNSTFKTNPALGRGLITGITRVSRESIFSDLNNLAVVTASTPRYGDCFGFTENEVFAAMEEFGLSADRTEIKRWYDGFVFGGVADIYNPWSITSYLKSGQFDTYWANTSGNALVSSLVRRGDDDVKADFQTLLEGGVIRKSLDEQVVFSELWSRPNALWALLLATGYLKALGPAPKYPREPRELAVTNHEVMLFFDDMVRGWFGEAGSSYNRFTRALLSGDVDAMNGYLSEVVRACVSSFDAGTHPSEYGEPERFYHGLVLGMLVELRGRYAVESNRESGYGRLDVALVPCGSATQGGPVAQGDPAVILEFKVFDPRCEGSLEDTVRRAHEQIEGKAYRTSLVERGVDPARIHAYGIAFRGKDVLVG